MNHRGGYGPGPSLLGRGPGNVQSETGMLMQQIQQLQNTVMELQAREMNNSGGNRGVGGRGGHGGFPGGPMSRNNFGNGPQMGGFGGGGYGPDSGFGGGYYNSGYGGGQGGQGGPGGNYPGGPGGPGGNYPGGPGGPGRYGQGAAGPRRTGEQRMKPSDKSNEVKEGEEIPPSEQNVILVSNIPPELSHPDFLYEIFEKFGMIERIKILHNKRNTALIQMSGPFAAQRAVNEQSVLNQNGSEIFVSFSSRFKEVKLPQPGSIHDDGLTKDYTGTQTNLRIMPKNQLAQNPFGFGGGYGGGGMGGMGMGMGDPMDMARGSNTVVLLVSNLPDEVANCDMIFNMLGAYGDVVCVKILRNKRDCALVQMAKPHHALQVRNHLDQAKIGGNKLCISNSRVDNLLNKQLIEDEGLQRDYSNSRQHRFRNHNQAMKLQRNLGPPTSVLHVANIPDGYTHIDIKEMFIERGFTVKDSKECNGNSHMCYLFFSGADEALMALAAMHNYAPDELKFKNTNGLCVSFSKAVKKD